MSNESLSDKAFWFVLVVGRLRALEVLCVRDVALVVVYQLGLGLFGPLSHCTLRHAIRPFTVGGLRDSVLLLFASGPLLV